MTQHYNENYFDWQKPMGVVGGVLDKFKFEKDINPNDVLMDFGCGGGYLLSSFPNNKKIGFEINRNAWNECKKNGISEMYDDFKNINNESVDTIISNHALEHVPSPIDVLKNLYSKLKVGGKLVVVIPCEQPHEAGFDYSPNDINQHLHTWCPMTLGNLATHAGFKVIECKTFQHQWTPSFMDDYKNRDYHQKCINYAKQNKNIQIKLVAVKS